MELFGEQPTREATVVFLSLATSRRVHGSPLLPSLALLFLFASIPLPFYPSGALHRATDRSAPDYNPQHWQGCDRATTRCSYISLRQLRSSRLIRASKPCARITDRRKGNRFLVAPQIYIYIYSILRNRIFFFFWFSSWFVAGHD